MPVLTRRPALKAPGLVLAAIVLAGAMAAVMPEPAHARVARWRAPVGGPIMGRFSYSPARPFAAGARRGVDLAAPTGAPVVAPCGGTVAYAGAVPRFGLGISMRCGGLTATVLGLGRVAVRRGEAVPPGAVLGSAGGAGSVRLGARVTTSRFAYRDPLALLRGVPRPPVPPAAGRRVGPRAPVEPSADPVRVPVTAPIVPAAAPGRAPGAGVAGWAGLALLALAAPVGGLAARRRHRSRRVAGGNAAMAEAG